MPEDAHFFTCSDEGYFVGTVALLNSLRITGNDGSLTVFDLGLTPAQRAALAPRAAIRAPAAPALLESLPMFAKPQGLLGEQAEIMVFADSDIMITDDLAGIVASAASGKICVFPDIDTSRRFPAWQSLLRLDAPMREQPYVNAGFIAFSTRHWPGFLERWWHACTSMVPGLDGGDGPFRPPAHDLADPSDANPFRQMDQDALNALLMSEIPAEALDIRPLGESVMRYFDLDGVHIRDGQSLACAKDGRPVSMIHYAGKGSKPWSRRAWSRIEDRDAYLELLPRVLLAGDVELRLSASSLPVWLRYDALGQATRAALAGLHRCARALVRLLPRSTGAEVRGRIRGGIGA